MKCLCLTCDNELINKFSRRNIFESVDTVSTLNQLFSTDVKHYDVLIISDRLAPHNSLGEIQTNASSDCQIYFLMSNYSNSYLYRQVQMQCLSHGISLVPPKLTTEQVTKYVLNILSPETEQHTSNVISFFGAYPGTGVTSITLAIAQQLSSLNVNVGVLGLNVLNPGEHFISKYEGLYLDELKSYLGNKVFSEDQLTNNMHSIRNFKYLAGNRDIKKRLYYTVEEISYLIQLAKNIFDIVLIDSGAQFDNALTIQSLLCSDLRFLISTQNLRVFHSWQLALKQIIEPLGFSDNSFLMILNRFKDNINLPNSKYLQDLYNISILQTTPDLGDLGLIAEQEKSLLLDSNVKKYEMSINTIVKNICKLYGIPASSQETASNKGIIRRLFSKS